MMMRNHTHTHEKPGRRYLRRAMVRAVLVLTIAFLLPTQAYAGETGAIVRSVLLPGLGQAQQGHYLKASIFAGTAIIAGVGLLVTSVHYNQAVNEYNAAKNVYLAYPAALQSGVVIPASQIQQTYDAVSTQWERAEDRLVTRNVFLGVLLGVYVVNIVDVIISKPYQIDKDAAETALKYSIDANRERVMVIRSFRF